MSTVDVVVVKGDKVSKKGSAGSPPSCSTSRSTSR